MAHASCAYVSETFSMWFDGNVVIWVAETNRQSRQERRREKEGVI